MGTRQRVFVADFSEPIKKFTRAINRDNLPTIDVDVVMSLLFKTFEKPDIPTAIDEKIKDLLVGDWLIENPAWVDKNEEVSMKRYLFQCMHDFAWEMYRELEQHGLFYNPQAKYSYKRMINDHTLIFSQLPELPGGSEA